MYKVGDIVIYKMDVCKIKEIRKNAFFNKDYYIMNPIDDSSLIIQAPVDNFSSFRSVATKQEAEDLISKIPTIEIIQSEDREIEYVYKRLFEEGTLENLIKVIKTTYMRNQERLSQNKRIGERDEVYFERAEKRLYNELSVSLNLTFDQTKQYVISEVCALVS